MGSKSSKQSNKLGYSDLPVEVSITVNLYTGEKMLIGVNQKEDIKSVKLKIEE